SKQNCTQRQLGKKGKNVTEEPHQLAHGRASMRKRAGGSNCTFGLGCNGNILLEFADISALTSGYHRETPLRCSLIFAAAWQLLRRSSPSGAGRRYIRRRWLNNFCLPECSEGEGRRAARKSF